MKADVFDTSSWSSHLEGATGYARKIVHVLINCSIRRAGAEASYAAPVSLFDTFTSRAGVEQYKCLDSFPRGPAKACLPVQLCELQGADCEISSVLLWEICMFHSEISKRDVYAKVRQPA